MAMQRRSRGHALTSHAVHRRDCAACHRHSERCLLFHASTRQHASSCDRQRTMVIMIIVSQHTARSVLCRALTTVITLVTAHSRRRWRRPQGQRNLDRATQHTWHGGLVHLHFVSFAGYRRRLGWAAQLSCPVRQDAAQRRLTSLSV